jgi:hypothetical protein
VAAIVSHFWTEIGRRPLVQLPLERMIPGNFD